MREVSAGSVCPGQFPGTARPGPGPPRGIGRHVRAICIFSGQAPGGDSAPAPTAAKVHLEKKPPRSTFPARFQTRGRHMAAAHSPGEGHGSGASGEAILCLL